MHTEATDGKDSIEEMATAGTKAGYDYIAITDHSKALAMAGGLDEEGLLRQIEKIDQASAENPKIEILKGIEVDILAEGELDLSDEVLSKLDVVVASVHSRFNLFSEGDDKQDLPCSGEPVCQHSGPPHRAASDTARALLSGNGRGDREGSGESGLPGNQRPPQPVGLERRTLPHGQRDGSAPQHQLGQPQHSDASLHAVRDLYGPTGAG